MGDARTYDQVSYLVQYKWGQQVLDWRKWYGDEIVIDAGCGSGLLTKKIKLHTSKYIQCMYVFKV
jgi:ubiquinone/menaquinone biosynthesis C-methylase UbiE